MITLKDRFKQFQSYDQFSPQAQVLAKEIIMYFAKHEKLIVQFQQDSTSTAFQNKTGGTWQAGHEFWSYKYDSAKDRLLSFVWLYFRFTINDTYQKADKKFTYWDKDNEYAKGSLHAVVQSVALNRLIRFLKKIDFDMAIEDYFQRSQYLMGQMIRCSASGYETPIHVAQKTLQEAVFFDFPVETRTAIIREFMSSCAKNRILNNGWIKNRSGWKKFAEQSGYGHYFQGMQ